MQLVTNRVRENKSYTLHFDNGHEETVNLEEFLRLREEMNAVKIDNPNFLESALRVIDHKPLLDKAVRLASSKRPVSLPHGFREIDRRPTYQGVHQKDDAWYVYGKNDTTLEYGFKRINGEESDFSIIGTIANPKTLIGSFARRALAEHEFTKRSMMRKYHMNGTRIKALLDILTIEGYLYAEKDEHKINFTLNYMVTMKLEGELAGSSSNLGATQYPAVLTR